MTRAERVEAGRVMRRIVQEVEAGQLVATGHRDAVIVAALDAAATSLGAVSHG